MTSSDLCLCGSGVPRDQCDPGELLACRFDDAPPHYFHRHYPAELYCSTHDKNSRRRLAWKRKREAREQALFSAAATIEE